MARTEVKFGGFGGQGVILAGMIIGKAAAIYDDKDATMIQAFGPEARGSACSSQVVVSDEYISYPYVKKPNVMVLMSQEALTKFVGDLAPEGLLLTEEELVQVDEVPPGVRHFSIPATRFAEELGRKIVLNIVMVGFFAAVSGLISKDAMINAIKASVPPGTEPLNLRAFEKGYSYGMELKSAAS